jgi:hypothetical protein
MGFVLAGRCVSEVTQGVAYPPGEVGQSLDVHFRYGAGLLEQPKMRPGRSR